jgi:cyclase
MKKNRIIPVVLFRNGYVVQSTGFQRYKNIGNPLLTINRLSEWGADEVCFLDISENRHWEESREDLREKVGTTFLEVLREASLFAYMPLTCGGGVRTFKDFEQRIESGADKIAINSLLFTNSNLITKFASEYGKQCLIGSVDVKKIRDRYIVYVESGKISTECEVTEWVRKIEDLGVGEILLNSIDRDGSGSGYDLELLELVCLNTTVPVIALGGVKKAKDLAEGLIKTKVDAVAAANYFQHRELSVYHSHKELYELGLNVRPPRLDSTDYGKEGRL